MARGGPATEAYESEVPVQEGMRRIIPDYQPAPVGGAIEQFGKSLLNAQDRIEKKDAAAHLAQALPAAQVQSEQIMLDAQQQPRDVIDKAGGLAPYTMSQFQQYRDKAISAAPNQMAKDALKANFAQMGAKLQIKAMGLDASNRVQQRVDALNEGIKTGATAVEIDPNLLGEVGGQQLAAQDAAGIDPHSRETLRQNTDSILRQAAGRGFAKQDPDGTLQRLNDPNDGLFSSLDEQTRGQLRTFAQGQLESKYGDAVVNAFRNGGPHAGAAAYSAIDSAPLTDDEKNQIRGHISTGLGQLNSDRRLQHADQITGLETAIASGNPPPNAKAQADGLYNSYALDQSQYASMLEGIGRAQKEKKKGNDILEYGMGAYGQGRSLDPKNPDDGKAANAVLSQISGDAAPNTDGYANAAVSIIKRNGIIPPFVISNARASLTSGTPDDAAKSANLLGRLEQENPRAFALQVDEADKATKAMAYSINNAIEAGTDPKLAVDMSRRNAALPKAEVEALDSQWKTQGLEKTQPGGLVSVLKGDENFKPHWYSGLPSVPPLMAGQFDQLTRDYYKVTGGNIDQARQLAGRDLGHTWGVSEVNGPKEILQYAPERMFPGLQAADVRADLAKTVADNASTLQRLNPTNGNLIGARVDASKVRLIATDDTARTGGLRWSLGAPDQFGAMDVLRGKDGNPLTYQLPVDQKSMQAIQDQRAQASIDKARAKQQLIERVRNDPTEAEPVGP